MLKNSKLLLLLFFIVTQCKSTENTTSYSSETLKIRSLSKNSFVHVSYLQTDSYGKVACNGYIYMKNGEAMVFDTPSDPKTTIELIHWLEHTKNQKIKGLVVNHFHIDALGGIAEFHRKKIPTFGHQKTIELAKTQSERPQESFEDQLILTVGGSEIVNRYFGEAHTVDNIVSYVPGEKILYGGCMVKSIKAGKGNLEDANEDAWSATIQKIKDAHPKAKTIIPGHGAHGGPELLTYTIELFKID